mgnify:CR=1 FL=1
MPRTVDPRRLPRGAPARGTAPDPPATGRTRARHTTSHHTTPEDPIHDDPDIDPLTGTNLTGHGFAKGKAARGERSGAWMTPRPVLDRALAVVRAVAGPASELWRGWGLDAAAEPGSAVCERWYGPGSLLRSDALAPEPWAPAVRGEPVWLNPPYDQFGPFAERAVVEAERGSWVAWLLFARTDTKAFQALWRSPRLAAFAFLPGRIRFIDPTTGVQGASAPAPSVLLVLGPGEHDAIRVRW